MELWYCEACVDKCFKSALKAVARQPKCSYTLRLDDHQIVTDDFQTVGESAEVCAKLVLKCSSIALIGRPDILWTAEFLAKHPTGWNRTGDKKIGQVSHFHKLQFPTIKNIAMGVNVGRVSFPDTEFACDSNDSKSTSGWNPLIV